MIKRIFDRAVSALMAAVMLCSVFVVSPVSAKENKSETAAAYDADKDILAYAVFGENVETKGMKVWLGDKNEPTSLIEGGKSAWVLDPGLGTASRYIYIDLDEDLVNFNSDGRNYEVTVEYFDKGIGSLVMEYYDLNIGNSNYKPRVYNTKAKTLGNVLETPILDFAGTDVWKSHTWLVQHPSFQDEMNDADFRVGIYSAIMDYSREEVYVASITVRDTGTRSQLGIDVTSDNLGHIFFTDETMEFDIGFDSSVNPVFAAKNGRYTADVRYTITDSRGIDVFSESRQIDINPNAKVFDHLSFKPEKYDLYELKIEVENKEKAVYSTDTAKCSYSWTTHGEILNPRAGISIGGLTNDKETTEGAAKLIRNAGYTYVRLNWAMNYLGRVSYNNVEPNEMTEDQYIGEYMLPFSKYGLKLTGYLGTNINVKNEVYPNLDYQSTQPATERGIKNFINFNRANLRLYGDALDSYGFCNEVNWQNPPDDHEHAKVYGEAIIRAYSQLKKEYPDITLIGPDHSHTTEKFWGEFFKTGVYDYLDVFTTHSYHQDISGTWPAEDGTYYDCDIAMLRRLMKEYGVEDKEVWLTEYGYPVYWQASTSEYTQACWEIMLYCVFSSPGQFDKLFKFQFWNANKDYRGYREHNWGLIRCEQPNVKDRCSAKPNYLVQSAMNILMSDAEQIERINMDETICYRYNKVNSGEEMIVLYKDGEGESDTVSLDLGVNEVTVYDMYGNQKKLSSTDGTYTFAVDMEPFYVTGNFKGVKEIETSVVRPDATLQPAIYDGEATVGFINNTGEKLTASISLLGGSQIEVEETVVIENGGSDIHFKFGKASPKKIEPVRVKIFDAAGKVYFDDDIFFKYFRPVTIDTELEINETDGWYFVTTMTNTSTKDAFTGTLQLLSPFDWMERVEQKTVTINPGETLSVKQKILKRDESITRLTATIGFIPDGDMANGQFCNKVFDFAYASKAENIKIDGDLSEWNEGWSYLNSNTQFEMVLTFGSSQYFGVEDLWTRVAAKWDEDNFYFAGEVNDDIFYAEGVDAANMWKIDDFQLGIVYGDVGTDTKKFEELSFALLEGTPTIYRHSTRLTGLEDSTKVDGAELAIVNNGTVTTYELKVPWNSIIPEFAEGDGKMQAGAGLRWSVLLNENDGEGREGYYKLGDGISGTKNSDKFVKLFMMD